MKTLKIRVLSLALIFVLIFSVSASALSLNATGAISINSYTGEVYYEKNADAQMTPASMTKIMTLYILFEKMAEGGFDESTPIPVSVNAANKSREKGVTNIPLTAGEMLQISTLIDAVGVVSACACATVVAEYISGSEWQFAQLMNETARNLGISAYFEDASGLSDNNLISPRGVAQLVNIFITKYPRILDYTSKASVTIKGKVYESTNYLLPISESNFCYAGADGFKTGTTTKAGKCFAATAQRNGNRVISVVMNSQTNDLRFTDTIALLNDAFSRTDSLSANMFTTDIRAFINGMEIPCYYKKFGTNEVCITAEDLRSYGFDTHYDEVTSTLYIMENPSKEFSPLVCQKSATEIAHNIYPHPNLKAVLVKGGVSYKLRTAVSLGGQCAISIDELGSYYTKLWNDSTRWIDIFTK